MVSLVKAELDRKQYNVLIWRQNPRKPELHGAPKQFQIFWEKKVHIGFRNILVYVARILFNNDAQQIAFKSAKKKWLRNSGLGQWEPIKIDLMLLKVPHFHWCFKITSVFSVSFALSNGSAFRCHYKMAVCVPPATSSSTTSTTVSCSRPRST